jgi:4-carboxymuconolactone decarboxylase
VSRPELIAQPDRMPPIPAENYTSEQRAAADRLIATPRGEVRGPFVPLLRSPELLDRSQALGEFLRYRCSIPVRLREFAILVTARHWRQPYEWLAHVKQAHAAGVTPETLECLANEVFPQAAPTDEQSIHAFVSSVHIRGEVSDEDYARVMALLGEAGLVELLGICGYYAMLAMMLNVARTSCADLSFPVPLPTDGEGTGQVSL